MKYYIIAGEASGDLHGSNLMKALCKVDVNAQFRFWGGDLMQAVGGTLVKHYKERAFMGFIEVIKNLNKIFKDIAYCKSDIDAFQPDALIFIDNSGFNLRIAKWAKQAGYRTHYYISPQVWASRAGRVKAIKRDVDAMYVILPFEAAFYKTYDYPVTFVGHPLIDAISNTPIVDEGHFRKTHLLSDKPILALLPGSRQQEVRKTLSIMLSLSASFQEYQFVIAGAPSLPHAFYKPFMTNSNIGFVPNKTHQLLSVSTAAIVTSGTATLETALFKVPQVVCYKGSAISYQIAKRIITLKYISLVNLIMDKKVVTELIQKDFNAVQLKEALNHILNPDTRTLIFSEYYELEKKLGGKGASRKTAELIFQSLKTKKTSL